MTVVYSTSQSGLLPSSPEVAPKLWPVNIHLYSYVVYTCIFVAVGTLLIVPVQIPPRPWFLVTQMGEGPSGITQWAYQGSANGHHNRTCVSRCLKRCLTERSSCVRITGTQTCPPPAPCPLFSFLRSGSPRHRHGRPLGANTTGTLVVQRGCVPFAASAVVACGG